MVNLRKSICTLFLISGIFSVPVLYAGENSPESTAAEKSDFSQKIHQRMEKKVEEIYSQLNLTDEQKKMLETNKKVHWEKRKSSFQKMKAFKDSLNEALMKPELEMNQINEIQTQLKSFYAQMTDERLNSLLEVRKILTPEQFAKFISLMEKHKRDRWGKEKE